jgi:hypothetical protein
MRVRRGEVGLVGLHLAGRVHLALAAVEGVICPSRFVLLAYLLVHDGAGVVERVAVVAAVAQYVVIRCLEVIER